MNRALGIVQKRIEDRLRRADSADQSQAINTHRAQSNIGVAGVRGEQRYPARFFRPSDGQRGTNGNLPVTRLQKGGERSVA